MEESTINLKLLIDTTKVKRVLFAEAGKDCVDLLFHLLSLPVASIVRLLQGQGMEGSLPNLYRSLKYLNDDYIQPNETKLTFLKPPVSNTSLLLPTPSISYIPTHKKFYGCKHCNKLRSSLYISDDPLAVCPRCGRVMEKNVTYVNPPDIRQAASGAGGGGLVNGEVTYMVMDDLVVKPMSVISSITLLSKFNVKEVGGQFWNERGCEVAQGFFEEQECSF